MAPAGFRAPAVGERGEWRPGTGGSQHGEPDPVGSARQRRGVHGGMLICLASPVAAVTSGVRRKMREGRGWRGAALEGDEGIGLPGC